MNTKNATFFFYFVNVFKISATYMGTLVLETLNTFRILASTFAGDSE